MTEQEYTNLSDRVRISNAYQILAMVIPNNSTVVEKKEYLSVMKIISTWEKKLLCINFIDLKIEKELKNERTKPI